MSTQEQLGLYAGFDSTDAAVSRMDILGVSRSAYIIIRFRKQFYVVCFESPSKGIIVCKQISFYSWNGRLCNSNTDELKLPYVLSKRVKKKFANESAKEILTIYDESIEALAYPTKRSSLPKAVSLDDYSNFVALFAMALQNHTDDKNGVTESKTSNKETKLEQLQVMKSRQEITSKIIISESAYVALQKLARNKRVSLSPSRMLVNTLEINGVYYSGLVPDLDYAKVKTLYIPTHIFEQLKHIQKRLNEDIWNLSLMDICIANLVFQGVMQPEGKIIGIVQDKGITSCQVGDILQNYNLDTNNVNWKSTSITANEKELFSKYRNFA